MYFMTSRFLLLIATGLGVGYLPKMPGTWGTILGCILGWLVFPSCSETQISLVIWGGFLLGFLTMTLLFHKNPSLPPDPAYVVIDEIVGIFLPLGWLYATRAPVSWQEVLCVFALFRFFDILKPWPIRWVERSFARSSKPAMKALGIMVDDVMAALPVVGLITGL
jgi:phosphatidylglycerophosphatase A